MKNKTPNWLCPRQIKSQVLVAILLCLLGVVLAAEVDQSTFDQRYQRTLQVCGLPSCVNCTQTGCSACNTELGFFMVSNNTCVNTSLSKVALEGKPEFLGSYYNPETKEVSLMFSEPAQSSRLIFVNTSAPAGVRLERLLSSAISIVRVKVPLAAKSLEVITRNLTCLDSAGKPWLRTESGIVPWQGSRTVDGGFTPLTWGQVAKQIFPLISLVSKVFGWQASVIFDQMVSDSVLFRVMPGAKGRIVWATDFVRSNAYFYPGVLTQFKFGDSHLLHLDRKGAVVDTMPLVTSSLLLNMADQLFFLGIFIAAGIITQIIITILSWNTKLSSDDHVKETLKQIAAQNGKKLTCKEKAAGCLFKYLKFLRWLETKIGLKKIPSLIHGLRLEILVFALINVANGPSTAALELWGYLLSAGFLSYYLVESVILFRLCDEVQDTYAKYRTAYDAVCAESTRRLEQKIFGGGKEEEMVVKDPEHEGSASREPIKYYQDTEEFYLGDRSGPQKSEALALPRGPVDTTLKDPAQGTVNDSSTPNLAEKAPLTQAQLDLLKYSLEITELAASPWAFAFPCVENLLRGQFRTAESLENGNSEQKDKRKPPQRLGQLNFFPLLLIDVLLSLGVFVKVPATSIEDSEWVFPVQSVLFGLLILARDCLWWTRGRPWPKGVAGRLQGIVRHFRGILHAILLIGMAVVEAAAGSRIGISGHLGANAQTIIDSLLLWAYIGTLCNAICSAILVIIFTIECSSSTKNESKPLVMGTETKIHDKVGRIVPKSSHQHHLLQEDRIPVTQVLETVTDPELVVVEPRPNPKPTHLLRMKLPPLLQPMKGVQDLDWNEAFKAHLAEGQHLEAMFALHTFSLASLKSLKSEGRLPRVQSKASLGSRGFQTDGSRSLRDDMDPLGFGTLESQVPDFGRQQINWHELYKNPGIYQKWKQYQEHLKLRLAQEEPN